MDAASLAKELTAPLTEIPFRLATALADRYRIERELGQGGMATVYLASDIKHDRKVALKVLKPELAAVLGAERFVIEIRTTASLSHPHILPLFDSGTADGFLFYVMPFIDGETLREKLNRETQLGIDESVKIASDIADALHYAHQHGVIHRDIKPENILLQNGRPMVADFGIALAVSAAAGGRMTETGLSLGTPHYMSPEQATAEKDISARSDIYSLACVLYEMLTGNPPHTGASAQQIIMKIITEEPQVVSALRKSVPPNVAAAVAKALEKLPADRFATALAFAEALANSGFATDMLAVNAHSAAGGGKRRDRLTSALVAVAFISTALALWGWLRPAPSGTAQPPMLLQLPFPAGEQFGVSSNEQWLNGSRPSRTAFAFSPDGKSLVYVGARGQLVLRPLDGAPATAIAGIEGAESPFFSPDGTAIGFWSAGQLQRVARSGGPASSILAVDGITGASWGEDDRIVIGTGSRLIVLSARGAVAAESLTVSDAGLPQFLPGGKSIIFTTGATSYFAAPKVEWLSLASGERKVLLDDAADARFLSTGHLLFARAGKVLAAPFDLSRNTITAAPFTVLPDVMQSLNGRHSSVRTGAMQLSISPLGQLAYLTGGMTPEGKGSVAWLDRQGRRTEINAPGGHAFGSVRLSPDETRLAISSGSRANPMQVLDLVRGNSRSFAGPAFQRYPLWTNDSRRIVAEGVVRDSLSLVWFSVDGSGLAEPLLPGLKFAGLAMFWSPDGSQLFAVRDENGPGSHGMNGTGVYSISFTDSTVHKLPFEGVPLWPALSPDGKWLAFAMRDASEGSGSQTSVNVTAWPSGGPIMKVSKGNSTSPLWTKDGRELLYLSVPDSTRGGEPMVIGEYVNRVMSVVVSPGPDFSPPRELFVANFARTTPRRSWDASADGSRFYVVNSRVEPAPPGDLRIITNWFAVLKQLGAQQGGGK